MDSEAFHPRVFLTEGGDNEVIRRIEAHSVLVGFGDNRQPGRNRSAHGVDQLSAHTGIPDMWGSRNMKQGYGGIDHRVADHTDGVVLGDGDEEGGGIIAVAPNDVLQSLVVARGERQQARDCGTVVDRRGVNRDVAVAHSGLFVVDASVQMHVVPTVEMQPRATLDAFEIEAGFDGDPARRQIVHRVCQFQPVEPDVIERPPCEGVHSTGCDILSAACGPRPIRHPALTTHQVHTFQRNPSQQVSGYGVCDGPMSVRSATPVRVPGVDPTLNFSTASRCADVPSADLRISEGLEHRLSIT